MRAAVTRDLPLTEAFLAGLWHSRGLKTPIPRSPHLGGRPGRFYPPTGSSIMATPGPIVYVRNKCSTSARGASVKADQAWRGPLPPRETIRHRVLPHVRTALHAGQTRTPPWVTQLVCCFRNTLTAFHPPSPWREGTGEGVESLEPSVSCPPSPPPSPPFVGRGDF